MSCFKLSISKTCFRNQKKSYWFNGFKVEEEYDGPAASPERKSIIHFVCFCFQGMSHNFKNCVIFQIMSSEKRHALSPWLWCLSKSPGSPHLPVSALIGWHGNSVSSHDIGHSQLSPRTGCDIENSQGMSRQSPTSRKVFVDFHEFRNHSFSNFEKLQKVPEKFTPDDHCLNGYLFGPIVSYVTFMICGIYFMWMDNGSEKFNQCLDTLGQSRLFLQFFYRI